MSSRRSSGFHIVRLNDTRTAGGAQIVQQVHLRHILLKPTELEDDATVQQKLSHMRDQIISGKEDFAVLAQDQLAGCRAPRSTAATWAGCEPGTFVPEFCSRGRIAQGG